MEERRQIEAVDRRAASRGGRRTADRPKPWYLRRRLWLAVASLAFVSWKRVRRVTRLTSHHDRAA